MLKCSASLLRERLIMDTSVVQNTQDFRIYAILNISEPPRLLISKCGGKQFHCYFSLPLPPQIVVFRLGKCNSNIWYNSRISIDISIGCESPSYRIGYLEKDVKSTCCEPEWSDDFLKRSHILHEKDKMAQLLLNIEGGQKNDKINVTSETFHQLEKRQLVIKLSKEPTPQLPAKVCSTKSPERPTKKMKKNNCTEDSSKGNNASIAVDINNNHLVQTTLTNCLSLASKKCNMTDFTPAPSPEPIVEIHDKLQNNVWPSSRWGHSVCAVSDNKVVVIGGQGEDYQMVKDSLCVLDHESNAWKIEKSHSYGADRRMGHTSTFDPVRKVIYVYGGSKNKRWFKDIHILNIETWKWSEIKAVGNAPKRSYHSSVLFQGELLVFGGVYPNPHPQPDGCSNDLYMFNLETSSWYQPIITGKQPLPRSGHSFKLCDENKAVIFGGWDAPQCYNDIITLDLALMEYNSPSVTGIKPTARSWHSSTLLSGNKLLIHGGFDEPNNRVLGDSFIFDIGKLTWLKVNTCPAILPRVGHTMFCVASENDEELVMLFGGGDNNGIFFNDLIHIQSFKD